MEDIIERINILMKQYGDSANSFAKRVDIDPGNFRRKLKGQSPITPRDITNISTSMSVNREWLENGTGLMWDFSEQDEKSPYNATEKAAATSAIIENNLLREQIADLRKQIDFLQETIKVMLASNKS